MRTRSKFEGRVLADLDVRRVDYIYEPEQIEYLFVARYKPDVRLPESGILVEMKGYFAPADRRKLLAIKAQNPRLDLRLLFQRASNKLNKKSKTTYGEWATKNGFIWAEGRVPDEWTRLPR